MWGPVIKDMITKLRADARLINILGGSHIYRNKTRVNIQIPGVYWSVVYAGLEENFAPVSVQLDVFAISADQSDQIEQSLFRILHSDLPVQFDNLLMWSQYLTRYDMHDENEGVVHSAVEFRFTPPRMDG